MFYVLIFSLLAVVLVVAALTARVTAPPEPGNGEDRGHSGRRPRLTADHGARPMPPSAGIGRRNGCNHSTPAASATEGSVSERRRQASAPVDESPDATGSERQRHAERRVDLPIQAGGDLSNCCPARPLPSFRGARVHRVVRAQLP